MNDLTSDSRCACGKLLFRGLILSGEVEVKCRSCKRISTIESFSGSALDRDRYVLVLNAEGTLLRFSASAPAILGYNSGELLKKEITQVIVMLSPDFYSSLWEVLSSRGPTIFLFHSLQYRKDRSMTPVEVEAQYLPGTTGSVIFTVKKKGATRLTTPVSPAL